MNYKHVLWLNVFFVFFILPMEQRKEFYAEIIGGDKNEKKNIEKVKTYVPQGELNGILQAVEIGHSM